MTDVEQLALLWDAAPAERRLAMLRDLPARVKPPCRFLDALADARFLKLPEDTRAALTPKLNQHTKG